MPKRLDLTGKVFGKWKAIKFSHLNKTKAAYWKVECECGVIGIVRTSALTDGSSTSCGCVAGELISKSRTTHGSTSSPEYHAWRGLKKRCLLEDNASYIHYGARGIKVCKEWLNSFETFLNDMGLKPTPKHTIERIDVNGNYEKSNCKWATWQEQQRNRRNNRLVEWGGKIKCISDWAEELGVNRSALSYRLINGGWSTEKAFCTKFK